MKAAILLKINFICKVDMSELTHFTQQGHAHMVDVADKVITHRIATAKGSIEMLPDTLTTLQQGNNKKGDVLGIARLAGIMAAKQTANLIPLCHPLSLNAVTIEFDVNETSSKIDCTATVKTDGKTGVEMEALTAVNIALLTIYDMCKAVDKGMVMKNIRLAAKSGGKSGNWLHPDETNLA
jgi:cyclic pyranopterin phosphate synthase